MHHLTRISLRYPVITGSIILLVTLVAVIGVLRTELFGGHAQNALPQAARRGLRHDREGPR